MLANKKPWGYESLAYQNENVAIWHLVLNPWEETSLHCHPNKKTGLVVLEGAAKVSFLSGGEKLFAGEKVMIRQGVFHKTRNMTGGQLQLFEIETPVNKGDLVRIEDKYNRPSQYDTEPTIEIHQTYPWLKPNRKKYHKVPQGSCWIKLKKLTRETRGIPTLNLAVNTKNPVLCMLVSGGLHKEKVIICSPGDVITAENLSHLCSKFTLLNDTEYIEITNEH